MGAPDCCAGQNIPVRKYPVSQNMPVRKYPVSQNIPVRKSSQSKYSSKNNQSVQMFP
jgi:hypothetical protein